MSTNSASPMSPASDEPASALDPISTLKIEELIDDVGNDAARFFFLMYSADRAMTFDLDLALSLERAPGVQVEVALDQPVQVGAAGGGRGRGAVLLVAFRQQSALPVPAR